VPIPQCFLKTLALRADGTSVADANLFPDEAGFSPRPAWQVIEAARRRYLTGELMLPTTPATRIFLRDGLVYFAERSSDGTLPIRLMVEGVITREQMQRGTVIVNGVEHVGRMFDTDPSIDRASVELCVELFTDDVMVSVANEVVPGYELTLYRRHPSGIDRWYPHSVPVTGRNGDTQDGSATTRAAADAAAAAKAAKPKPKPEPQVSDPQRPQAQQPETQQPETQQPETQQPVAQQTVARQPEVQRPVAQQAVAQQPVEQQTVENQPVKQQPVAQQVAQQPVAQQAEAQPAARAEVKAEAKPEVRVAPQPQPEPENKPEPRNNLNAPPITQAVPVIRAGSPVPPPPITQAVPMISPITQAVPTISPITTQVPLANMPPPTTQIPVTAPNASSPEVDAAAIADEVAEAIKRAFAGMGSGL
jgi:DNA polymerase III gamma/tau subunit